MPWAVPPGQPPLNAHRYMGVDVSFEFLGDGLARSFLEEEQRPEIEALQLEALKALLRLAPTHWLGHGVVSAIVLGEDLHDPLFTTQLGDELRAAVTESVRRLRTGPPPKFELDLQTIELLAFLVPLDDRAAAEAVEGLIGVLGDDHQRLRDLQQALDGTLAHAPRRCASGSTASSPPAAGRTTRTGGGSISPDALLFEPGGAAGSYQPVG